MGGDTEEDLEEENVGAVLVGKAESKGQPGHIAARCKSWPANVVRHDNGKGQGVFRLPASIRKRRPCAAVGLEC